MASFIYVICKFSKQNNCEVPAIEGYVLSYFIKRETIQKKVPFTYVVTPPLFRMQLSYFIKRESLCCVGYHSSEQVEVYTKKERVPDTETHSHYEKQMTEITQQDS